MALDAANKPVQKKKKPAVTVTPIDDIFSAEDENSAKLIREGKMTPFEAKAKATKEEPKPKRRKIVIDDEDIKVLFALR